MIVHEAEEFKKKTNVKCEKEFKTWWGEQTVLKTAGRDWLKS